MKKLGKELVKGSAWNLSYTLLNRGGALILSIILMRLLLPEGYGLYNLALSVALIFVTFTDLGINTTLTRYISYSIVHNKEKAAAYYKYLLSMKIKLSGAVSAILLILAYPLAFYIFHKPELFIPLIISGFYILFLTFEGFYTSFFYVNKRIDFVNIKELGSQILKIGLVILVFVFIAKQYHVSGVLISLIISSIAIILFSYYYSKKLSPEVFKDTQEEIDKKRVLKYLSMLTIGSISAVFFSYIDTLMLGIFLPAEFIGYYRSAFSIIYSVSSLFAISTILMPYFAQIKKQSLPQFFDKIAYYTFIFTIPSFFGVALLSNYLLVLFGGHSYLPGTIILQIMALLIIEMPLTSLYTTLFSAIEKPQYFVKFLIITTILNILLNYILIVSLLKISPLYATAGSAIAILVSRYIYLALLAFSAKKRLGIKLFTNIHKPIIASLIMFGAMILFSRLIAEMTVVLGILDIIFGAFVYFISLYILKGITKEDLNMVTSLLKRNKK